MFDWVDGYISLYPKDRVRWYGFSIVRAAGILPKSMASSLYQTQPYAPWPNKSEATVRVFKDTLFDLCAQIGSSPELNQLTVREHLKQTSALRNSMVPFWRKTPVELVSGRPRRDVVTITKLITWATDDTGNNPRIGWPNLTEVGY